MPLQGSEAKYMNERALRPVHRVKIQRTSMSDQICASIKEDIIKGVYQAGSKLPSEAQLTEIFGVNRLSVRMALQKLNTLGFVETKVGDGSYVMPYSLRPILNEISILYQSDEKYSEVQQLRSLLENECLRIAIENATEEEIAQLKVRLEHYRKTHLIYAKNVDDRQCLEDVVDADFAFHYQVVKMSHNSLYKDIYYMVQQLIREHITKLIFTRAHRRLERGEDPALPNSENDTHVQIYEGIASGKLDETIDASKRMLGIIPLDIDRDL